VSHLRTDVEISCLPKDLPEALEVDMAGMSLNDTVYLKDIKLPAGVTIPLLATGREIPVVAIHAPRAEEPEAAATEAVAAVPTAGDAKKAADAKAGDAKGGDAKGGDAKKDAGKK
jgi:large subunit ribosomal protein L25